jgi:hypothetical protein
MHRVDRMTTSEQTTEGTTERSTEQSTETAESKPQEAAAGQPGAEGKAEEEHHRMRDAVDFARRHPLLTLAGAAGASLVGGFELAAGFLVGAGVARFLRPQPDGQRLREKAREQRGRARAALGRLVPGELRARTRAVVQAARGKPAPAA